MKYIKLPKLTILAILFKITSIRLYKNPTDCFLLLPTQDNQWDSITVKQRATIFLPLEVILK